VTATRVLTAGEALVSLLPGPGGRLELGAPLTSFLGGAEVNVAVGLARLGVDVSWAGRVGEDPWGQQTRTRLEREGVDTGWVITDEERPTGLYLREYLPDARRRPYYYRAGSAGSALRPEDVPPAVGGASWLHITGITAALGAGPAAFAEEALRRAGQAGALRSLDLNYRQALWTPDRAAPVLRRLAAAADVLFVSEEDAVLVLGTDTAEDTASAGHALGPRRIVVTQGAQGGLVSEDGSVRAYEALPSETVDPVGAGDGFVAGVLAVLSSGGGLWQGTRLGAYVGAAAARSVGEHEGYPHRDALPRELAALLDAPP
jgi:2-dehydro-3-deoxygluconokinase